MASLTSAEVSWQDYLAIILRRRWLFLVPCVTIVLGTTLVSFTMPKIYRAETVLLVQDPKIMNPLIKGMAVATPVETQMRIVREEMLGWTSVSRLVHELGLDKTVKTPGAFESLVKRVRRNMNVHSGTGGLVKLTYEHQDPKLAQQALNTITAIYVERNVEAQTAEAETAIQFIEREMEQYLAKLETSELALREFKELYAVEMPVAIQLNRQIIGMEVRLAQLLVDNTEAHPVVAQIRRQIYELKQKRNEEVRRAIASAIAKSDNPAMYQELARSLEATPSADALAANSDLRAAHEAYQTWVDQLDRPTVADPKAPVAATPPMPGHTDDGDGETVSIQADDFGMISVTLSPRQEQELVRLRRDYEINRKTYERMQERLERARITQRLGESDEGTKFKVIEPARLPLKPVKPQPWAMFWSALGIGLMVGVCAAFGAEFLDQSFQTSEDLQAAVALPVIGSISRIVTAQDIEARNRQMRGWVSLQQQARRLRARVVQPVWVRIDRAIGRWGL